MFVLLRSVEEHRSAITPVCGLESLFHIAKKKFILQLHFLKNWLSKSHPCVISVFDAGYKLTVEIDLEESDVEWNKHILGSKKGFQKGAATAVSRFQLISVVVC